MMDILLEPNIAYLLLVAGFWLAILALLSPGSGFFELGALFAWLLAGWAVYQLPANLWALGVLALGVFPFLLALRRSRQPVFLVISILALVVGSTFLFRGEGWRPAVHPALALLVSTMTVGFFWIVARKALEAENVPPSHDLDALLGAIGEARTEIGAEGSVQVGGELWSAQSAQPISPGTQVRVTGREGLILSVEPLEN